MRVSLGGDITVTATERWLSEIRAGRGFVGGSSQGPTAANFDHVQLINPAGSAITVLCRLAVVSRGAAGIMELRTFNTALATLSNTPANLLAGGAAAVGQVRVTANAARQGTLVTQMELAAGTPLISSPEWFFELGAAEGFLYVPDTVNVRTTATFMWVELS